jgi:transposase-like protein
MELKVEQLDELLVDCKSPGDVDRLYSQLLQRLINRSLEAELAVHLGEGKSADTVNRRNGKLAKTVKGTFGELEIETPRDRQGSFEPQLVKKRQVRLGGMEEKILALYARGMTNRDIESALQDLYGVNVSHSIISQVTDAVLDEVHAWQSRPLETVYPIVWLDGIVVKVHQGKQVIKKAVHIVLGVNLRGEKEVLGLWITENEGAKFWLSVLTELKNRGVKDIFIACMDGLKGLPEAVNTLYPKTLTQLCIVHLVRASLRYVTAGDSKAVVAMLKAIYQSATVEEAERELLALEAVWGDKYRAVIRLWRNNWDNIIPFFQFPPEIRKIIYTTNAIESLNANLRKLTRNRRIFPNDESVFKAMYLAIRQCADKWSIIHHWKPALQVFQIAFGEDRIPLNEL